ncbi:unnamed protein product [Dicrocoelium dendriticum]|nr:unnamed protein product [Dicrocoelium dendriticum]
MRAVVFAMIWIISASVTHCCVSNTGRTQYCMCGTKGLYWPPANTYVDDGLTITRQRICWPECTLVTV